MFWLVFGNLAIACQFAAIEFLLPSAEAPGSWMELAGLAAILPGVVLRVVLGRGPYVPSAVVLSTAIYALAGGLVGEAIFRVWRRRGP